MPRRGRPRAAAEPRHRSVGQHHLLLSTWSIVLPYITERAPLELLAIMPPTVARLAVETSGAKRRPCGLQRGVQLVEHDARLDAGPRAVDVQLEHRLQIPRRVDDEAGADGLAGLRRAAAAQRDRTRAARQIGRATHIVARARHRHAERLI